jgi:hypothetical protein
MELSHLRRKNKNAPKMGHPGWWVTSTPAGRKAAAGPSTPLKYASLRMTGQLGQFDLEAGAGDVFVLDLLRLFGFVAG